MLIRYAKEADIPALLAIYGPYVEKTAITFEYEPPSLDSFRKRWQSISAFYPFLVIEKEGEILGYAYASAFQSRPAYAWSVETSIYLAEKARGQGLGHALYHRLEADLQKMGVTNINACIAQARQEGPYLSHASRHFHEKEGFRLVGTFHKSGYKFQEWFDMVWMEKIINPHQSDMPKVQSIQEVLAEKRQNSN
ncbi:GNAT family N-acetyltransferase [Streptococcus sp. DD12]|uniref:GNAT family N-acetyltransferase n=1 Tax=Streptococcus sp. DD12 TaxID=1777880 RepID=UPI000797D598|nr:GNAT family N-acetyltransferase [Streptococcus sp. DD12]KXT76254.1 Phosphinothricin N-acetyltransferase [Streptococcus sp. DD12]